MLLFYINHTASTEWYLGNFLYLTIHILLLALIILVKQLLYSHAPRNVLVATKQTAIASAVPEAPSETDAVCIAIDDLAAYLADGKVDDGTEARVAS